MIEILYYHFVFEITVTFINFLYDQKNPNCILSSRLKNFWTLWQTSENLIYVHGVFMCRLGLLSGYVVFTAGWVYCRWKPRLISCLLSPPQKPQSGITPWGQALELQIFFVLIGPIWSYSFRRSHVVCMYRFVDTIFRRWF